MKLNKDSNIAVHFSVVRCYDGTNVSVKSNLQHAPPPGIPGIPRAFDTFAVPGRREFDYQSLLGGGEFEMHPRFHVKSLAWRPIIPGGALGYFLGGYVPLGTPNWHPVLKKISPQIDTPF